MPARSAGSRATRLRSRSVSPACLAAPDQDLLANKAFLEVLLLGLWPLLLVLLLSACSGGSSKSAANAGFRCANGVADVLCLQSCNLGCSETGCSRTEIAQNELIVLTFSEDVDPHSVSSSSILFRTPTGAEAVGEFLVNGNRVEFVPSLSVSGGQTFYGFTSGDTYVMTIIGADNQPAVVRGTSGRAFGQTLSCTLQSRRGIIDYDGAPPSAKLVSPRLASGVPRDTVIELEFSELIDPTPFVNLVQSPVRFYVRGGVVDAQGEIVCDPNSDRQPLAGSQFPTFDAARGVTVLSFLPSAPLPGNACVEIELGIEISDLSGRAALPQAFTFSTEQVPLQEFRIVEDFTSAEHFDRDASAAIWGDGELAFLKIGGDGRHGRFDVTLAGAPTMVGGIPVYTLDCDNTLVPQANTSTGAALSITDGQFFFTEFVVPEGVRLRFVGTSPPIVTACGRIEIHGAIDISGESLTSLPSLSFGASLAPGQTGGVGGVFAGSGGRGGDQCNGAGNGGGAYAGQHGGDAMLVAGHAYATSRIGTGGRGSELFPASGLNAERLFHPQGTGGRVCLNMVAGGGGGSSLLLGEIGRLLASNSPDPATGIAPWAASLPPEPAAASLLQLLPYPSVGFSQPASRHFLVGGAGGGGAASNAAFILETLSNPVWAPGGGGGGGGGALALRAGRSLRLGETGRVRAVGGSTTDIVTTNTPLPRSMPGGGGAGGSIVLQCDDEVVLNGSVWVDGGVGGTSQHSYGVPPAGASIVSKAGDGAPGLVRLEAPAATSGSLSGAVQPVEAVVSAAELLEQDGLVACQSLFYSTGLSLAPEYVRYEITAIVDGVIMQFSDDPQVGMLAGIGAPLRLLCQAANVDLTTGVLSNFKPWRLGVRSTPNQAGIASDLQNAFRYRLIVDRALAQSVVVTRVEVVYRN